MTTTKPHVRLYAAAEDATMTDPRLLTEYELTRIQVIVRGAGYRHPDARHLAARVTEHIETMPLTREDHS